MVKALTWTPDKLQILGIKKDSPAQSLHSVLSVNEGGVLVNPDILAPVPAAPFSVKSHTGGLHLHPAFAFESVRYYTNAAKAMTTVREGAVTLLGTGVAGSMVFNPVALLLEITTPPGSVAPDQVLTINYDHGALLRVTVYYQINGGTVQEYQEFNATGTFNFDTAGIVFNHADVLTIIAKDSESTLQDTVDFTTVVKSITIDSLNNGDPFYFTGEFTEGVHYFFTNDGRIVPSTDPDITTWCVGLGDENNDLILYSGQVMITSPLSGAVYETICNIPISYLHQNEATNINVYTSINGGIETLFESEAPVSAVYTLDTTLLSLTDGDTLKIIIKNSDNEFHRTEVTLNIIETIIEITSIEEYDE